MSDSIRNKSSFFYNFLINPRYRIWRYVVLIIGFSIISLNQAFAVFREGLDILGSGIYFCAFLFFASYSLGVYVTLKMLMPKYLERKQYGRFVIGVVVVVLLLTVIQNTIEYAVYKYMDIRYGEVSFFNPDNSVVLDSLSTFITTIICLAGMSVTIILKQWMEYNQRINKLEKDQIQSEVEQLKDQIAPVFLFNVLNRTGVLAKTEPEKTSDMLMKLSSVLRYQLYDCARGKVLLGAEISFIRNYMNLQKAYHDKLDYSISIEGDINAILLPPLLFTPFIQDATDSTGNEKHFLMIDIRFFTDRNRITFSCSSENNAMESSNLVNIKRRLDLLFPGRYSVDTVYEKESDRKYVRLQLIINER